MPIPIQDEDLTTEKLADLLRSSTKVLHSFLQLMFEDTGVAKEHCTKNLYIETQHRFSIGKSGRFDLLLHEGSTGIIVECKTRDKAKVYQLEKYHKYWTGKHGREPFIFWLVRKKAGTLGINPYLEREVTWDQLYDHLKRAAEGEKNAEVKASIYAFCQYLEEAMILLQVGERGSHVYRSRGYEYDVAERLLRNVAEHFDDVSFEVVAPMNGVSHQLFLGKTVWRPKFKDDWIQRVVLQYKADKTSQQVFWHGNIMLYNRHNVVNPSFAIEKLPKWAPICKAAGLRLLRNRGHEWSGSYSYEIEPPYNITRPVKYFHAPLPDKTWPIIRFEKDDELKMIAEGVRIVEYLCDVVNRF